jgi:hypothetical protein
MGAFHVDCEIQNRAQLHEIRGGTEHLRCFWQQKEYTNSLPNEEVSR